MPLQVNLAHHAFPRIHRATSCAGPGWLLPGKSVAQELHEHQRLEPMADAHAFGIQRIVMSPCAA